MAGENIRAANNNFCISPILGTYCSIDTTNVTSVLQVKNTSGNTASSYSFDDNFNIGSVIHKLEYLGPKGNVSFSDNMLFFTCQYFDDTSELEDPSNAYLEIKQWSVETSTNRLLKENTITKQYIEGLDRFEGHTMCVSNYYTSFYSTTTTGVGFIVVDDVSYITTSSWIYLGQSNNPNNTDAFEKAYVTSVSGNTVYLYGDITPPLYFYNIGDTVTVVNDMFFPSNYDNNDSTIGTLYKLDKTTGNIIDTHESALYKDVSALSFNYYYSNSIGLIKAAQLLYVNLIDYEVIRSSRLNTYTDRNTYIEVEDLAFDDTTIYRLQGSRAQRSDENMLFTDNWSTYNIHYDSIAPYVDVISMWCGYPGILFNQTNIILYSKVIDQYGVGVSGKTVQYARDTDFAGEFEDVNAQAITDINGNCNIEYTSGWYNYALTTNYSLDITFNSTTDGSNIFTGSTDVYSTKTTYLYPSYLIGKNNTPFGYELLTLIPSMINEGQLELKDDLEVETNTWYSIGKLEILDAVLGRVLDTVISTILPELLPEIELSEITLNAENSFTDTLQLSQNYISRHLPEGSNEVTATIAQFRFLIDAVPIPFSYKNNPNTYIWIRLAPYGFSLNKDTLMFKVREASYVRDTGYVTFEESSIFSIQEFDAGGGLIGLELLFDDIPYFYHNALVYVYLEVYDMAEPPNLIKLDYWFKIISDYIAPYITNEYPKPSSLNVATNTNISFDVLDVGTGVDMETFQFFVNERLKPFNYIQIEDGYHVESDLNFEFYHNQTVMVMVDVIDKSVLKNRFKYGWSFTTDKGLIPYVDKDSFIPQVCQRGLPTRMTNISFNFYSGGDSIDLDTLNIHLDGRLIYPKLIPIVRRID